jgi:hypothetical protein
MWVLLTVKNGTIVPSEYAKAARKAGLDIITWTTERSGRLVEDVLQGGNCCNNTLHGGGGEPDRTPRVRRRGDVEYCFGIALSLLSPGGVS